MKTVYALIVTAVLSTQVSPFQQLNAQPTEGRTFYVSASGGSDENTGMTPENAWRTLRRTTTAGLLPGDSVLLQRGDSWRESLTIRDSGDSLRRIKFASYGTGARPRLFGSSDGTGVSNWQSAGDSLWYCENIAQPPGMLFMNRSAMRERSSLADLAESSTWYYEASSGRVYVKLRVNPGSFEMEIAERDGIVVQGVSNIEVRDLDIQYASNGVTMQGAHDVLIENVTIHDMAYSGIYADGASTNNTVVHCAFTDWNWGISRARTAEGVAEPGAGIFLRGGENAPSVNWIIEKNSFTLSDATGRSETAAIRVSERGHALLIADNRIKGYAGVALSGVVITKPLGEQPMLIRGNEVTNCAGGAIRIEDLAAYGFSAGITLERNRVIDSAAQDETEQAAITLRTGGSFPVSLRYNTVAGTLKGEHDHDALSVRASSGVTIFHNVFYGADCGVSLKEGSEAVALNNIASENRKCAIWRDAESTLNERHNDLDGPAIGFEPSTTSFSAEPIFAGAGKGDFQLGAGSPCRDRGEEIAGIDQETIGMAPDVGAEEYRSGTELATEPEKVTSAGLSIRAAAATTNTATIQVKYLSDLTWTSMTNGWGPAEKDKSNGEQSTGDGKTITLNGTTYAKGLGIHAPSTIKYSLAGTCTAFTAAAGMDDESGSNGSVIFQVWADGTKLYDSGTMTGVTATKPVAVDLTNRSELSLVVTDDGNGNSYDHADWADAQLTCVVPGTIPPPTSPPAPASAETYLSDLTWTSMTNAWGSVEKDKSNGEQSTGDGNTITLNGMTYAKGLGVHAGSTITYSLGGKCTAFNAAIGMDDEVGANGSVVFQVWADGNKLYDSGTMTGATATKPVAADLTGRSLLSLVVTDAGDGNASDHADWANATITCGTTTPSSTIPTNGLGVWFKADAGITSKGSLVSQWSDQSGNARHATQTTSASQPTVVSNVLSGKPVIRYDGTSDSMSFTMPISGLAAMTLILVSASASDVDGTYYGEQNAPLFWRETGSWGTVHLSPFQRYVRHRFGTGQSDNIPSYSRPSPVVGYSVTTAVKNGTSENVYVNGTQVAGLIGKLV